MIQLPKIKLTDIVLQDRGSELLIKDLLVNKVYHLNEAASRVYQACDGKTLAAEMSSRLQIPAETVFQAIDELDSLNLIENSAASAGVTLKGKRIRRREAFRLFGVAGLFALIGNVFTGCGGGSDVSIPVQGGSMMPVTTTPNPFTPPSTPGDAGYVPVAYNSAGPGADTNTNKAACLMAAMTACKSGKATLVCTQPGNNYCACTCL